MTTNHGNHCGNKFSNWHAHLFLRGFKAFFSSSLSVILAFAAFNFAFFLLIFNQFCEFLKYSWFKKHGSTSQISNDFYKVNNFRDFLTAFLCTKPLGNTVYSTWKELAPQSNFISCRVDNNWKGKKETRHIFKELPPLIVYSFIFFFHCCPVYEVSTKCLLSLKNLDNPF